MPLGCRHTRRRNPKLLGKLSASTVSLKLCEGSLEPWPAALWVVGDPKRGKRGRIRSGPNGALLGETEEIGLHVIRLTAYRRLVRLHAGCFALRRSGCRRVWRARAGMPSIAPCWELINNEAVFMEQRFNYLVSFVIFLRITCADRQESARSGSAIRRRTSSPRQHELRPCCRWRLLSRSRYGRRAHRCSARRCRACGSLMRRRRAGAWLPCVLSRRPTAVAPSPTTSHHCSPERSSSSGPGRSVLCSRTLATRSTPFLSAA